MKMPFNLHPKVTAAALITVLTSIVVFATNGFGLKLSATEWILVDGAIAGLVGYLMPTGTWEPKVATPPAAVPPPNNLRA